MSGSSRAEAPASLLILHRAPWLVPVSRMPVPNGAVLIEGNTIIAAGPYEAVLKQCPTQYKLVEHDSCALIPALVNAHTHVELSALRGLIPLPRKSFSDWLCELMQRRLSLSDDEIAAGIEAGEQELFRSGTGLYGDINNARSETLAADLARPRRPARHLFLELIGFNVTELEAALPDGSIETVLKEEKRVASLAAHSCYATSAPLIRGSKHWSGSRGLPFTIHAAEHTEEVEFLQTGSGFCRTLLGSLGRWVEDWTPPRTTPIQYLDRIGVLDSRTILVHCVHVSQADWELIKRRRCSVCFCPRSNAALGVGAPQIEYAVRFGIPAALGTDSLASNSDLSLFSEAAYILDHYPTISPETVLSMATMGGASALQKSAGFGSMEPGKAAALLSVHLPESLAGSQLAEAIIYQGSKGAFQWTSIPLIA